MTFIEAFKTGLKFRRSTFNHQFWWKKVNDDEYVILKNGINDCTFKIVKQDYLPTDFNKDNWMIDTSDEFHAQLEKLSE